MFEFLFVCVQGNVYNYCSGQLLCTIGVNYEATPNITLSITATDSNFHKLKADFIVQVLDENDPPTVNLLFGFDFCNTVKPVK
jgi:hypothetical protein